MSTIDDKTKIAVGLLLPLIGGIAWLSSIDSQGKANAMVIQQIQVKVDKAENMAVDIAVIKTQLAEISKKLDKSSR